MLHTVSLIALLCWAALLFVQFRRDPLPLTCGRRYCGPQPHFGGSSRARLMHRNCVGPVGGSLTDLQRSHSNHHASSRFLIKLVDVGKERSGGISTSRNSLASILKIVLIRVRANLSRAAQQQSGIVCDSGVSKSEGRICRTDLTISAAFEAVGDPEANLESQLAKNLLKKTRYHVLPAV